MPANERTTRAPRKDGASGASRQARFVGLGLAFLVTLLHLGGLFDSFEGWLIDRRSHWSVVHSPEPTDAIVHVDIDEEALEKIDRWPWDRVDLAYAIDAMRLAGARTILLDLLLTHRQRERFVPAAVGGVWFEDDAELERAIREAGNVLLACAIESRTGGDTEALELRARLPIHRLRDEVAGIGFVDAGFGDDDTYVRALPVTISVEGERFTQLGVLAAAHFDGVDAALIDVSEGSLRVGDRHVSLRDGRFLVPWRPRTEAEVAARQEEAATGGRPFVQVDGQPKAWQHIHDRVSITELVQVGRTLMSFEMQQRRAIGVILGDAHEGPVTPEVIALVDDEVEFQRPDIDPASPDLDDYERAVLAWPTLRSAEANEATREAMGVLALLRDRLEGKLVVVGWTAEGAIADFYPTALGGRTPGAMVHSAIANGLLTGHWLHRVPAWVDIVVTLVMGLLGALIGVYFKPGRGWIATLALLLVFVASNIWWWFGVQDTVVVLAAPVFACAVSWTGVRLVRAVDDLRERNRVMRQFRSRVSSRLVEYLAEHPERMNMEGEERELTMCFTDLAGFTSLSEQLGGERTVRVLNRCLSDLTEALLAEQAYVNKFLGDGVMSFWGAPIEDDEQADHAVRALRRCYEALASINTTHAKEGLPALGLRAGIATGRVIVGDCGAPPTLNDYTVIGDSVNLAARLESANKQLGTAALINGRTHDLLSEQTKRDILLRPLGEVRVVGQNTPSRVYEIVIPGPDQDEDALRGWVELTADAVEAYRSGGIAEALALWTSLAERDEGRAGALLYQHACEAVLRGDREHDGVLTLGTK